MFTLICLVFYFFILRPQLKKQKSEKDFQDSLKKGDKIVTNSGLHAKIFELNSDFCIIETYNGKIKIERDSISRITTELRYKK